ncbi:MAG: glycosyltransferase [Bacillota bacterium]
MRVLLVNPSGGYFPHEYPPLGLLYIASYLRANGHVVGFYDEGAIRRDRLSIWSYAEAFEPEVSGFSLYTTNVLHAYELIKQCKARFPECTVIAGGPHATAVPELTMAECPQVDYLVVGEGEITTAELLAALARGEDASGISGVVLRRPGSDPCRGVMAGPPRQRIPNLDLLPHPAYDLLEGSEYSGDQLVLGTRVASVITSRGCPHNCVFCNKAVFGSRYVRRSPVNVAEEIEALVRRSGVDSIYFMDDLFAVDRGWLEEFFCEMEARGLRLPWKCEGRVDSLGPATFKLMRAHGCYLVQFGVESGNNEVLQDIRKRITVDKAQAAFKAARAAGLMTHGFFMLGHRLDTRATIRETMDFAKSLDPDFVSFFVLVPFPGTEVSKLVPDEVRHDWSRIQYLGWGRARTEMPVSICEVSPEDLLSYQEQALPEYFGRMRYLRRNVFETPADNELLKLKEEWWASFSRRLIMLEKQGARVFVLEMDRKRAEKLLDDAVVLMKRGDFEAAMAALEEAEPGMLTNPDLLNGLGVCYFETSRRGTPLARLAKLCFERALAFDPAHAGARANLAMLAGKPASGVADCRGDREKLPDLLSIAGLEPKRAGVHSGDRPSSSGTRASESSSPCLRVTPSVEPVLPRETRESCARLALVTTYNQRCGLAGYARYLCDHLDPATTHILAETCSDAERIHDDGSNVVRCWNRTNPDYGELCRSVGLLGVEIVHVNFQVGLFHPSLVDAARAWRREGRRTVVTAHATPFGVFDYRKLSGVIDAFVVHTSQNKLELVAQGCDPEKIRVIPHGCPPPSHKDISDAKADLGVPRGTRVIVSFGFIDPHKGILEVIDAVAALRKHMDVMYIVLGTVHPHSRVGAEYLSACKNRAHSLGISDSVIFREEFLEDEAIMRIIQASDVIVMNYKSTRFEPSLAVRVALSAGRPVVVSATPPFADLGEAVLRASGGLPLAQAIYLVLANPFLAKSLSDAAISYVIEHGWDRTAAAYSELYGRVAHMSSSAGTDVDLLERYYSHPDSIYDEAASRERIQWLRGQAAGNVLEVGCATGYVAEYIGASVGVDIDEGRLEVARRLRRGCRFVNADITGSLPFKGGEFDTVAVPDVIEHLDLSQVPHALRECARVGKRIILTVPNAGKPNFRKDLVDNPEHKWRAIKENLTHLLVENTGKAPVITTTSEEDFLLAVVDLHAPPEPTETSPHTVLTGLAPCPDGEITPDGTAAAPSVSRQETRGSEEAEGRKNVSLGAASLPAGTPGAGDVVVPIVPIVWHAPVFDPSGYAGQARNLVLALDRLGADVRLRPIRWSRLGAGLGGDVSANLESLASRPSPKAGFVNVWHVFPPSLYRRMDGAVLNVGRLLFETDRIPESWVGALNGMDEIWVPSAHNVESFARSGVSPDKLVKIPEPVDTSVFDPGSPVPRLNIDGAKGFKFLSVFDWQRRKGWDVLISAYIEAFDQHDDVSLVIKTYSSWGRTADGIDGDISEFLKSLGRSLRDIPQIVLICGVMSHRDLVGLYKAADAFVLPSRAEGWGCPYAEAMSMALPTIGTRWGGNTEFMNDQNSFLIDVEDLEEVPEEVLHEVPLYKGHKWARPSTNHLASLMRKVFDDREEAVKVGRRARTDMEERFSCDVVAQALLSHLRERSPSERSGPARKAGIRVADQDDVRAGRSPSERTEGAVVGPERRGVGTGGPVAAVKPRRRATRGREKQGAGKKSEMRLVWQGSFFVNHSLAHVNREMALALLRDPRVKLGLVPYEPDEFGPGDDPVLLRLAARIAGFPGAADFHVRHMWPPKFDEPPGGAALIVMQPWEFGALPVPWVEPLKRAVWDVWAPTGYVKDVFVSGGIPEDKVCVIPYGFNPDLYHPGSNTRGPSAGSEAKRVFRFLFVGGTIPRKGADVLLRAYLREFRPDEEVCLVVKDFGTTSFYAGQGLGPEIARIAARSDVPRIVYTDTVLNWRAMPELFRSADCLVHPFRGEGFGLPVLEAMACEVPVVVTGYGACLDFVNPDVAYLVEAKQVVWDDKRVGAMPTVDYPRMAEPSEEHLRHLMRYVFEHREEAKEKAGKARQYVLDRFTWTHAARKAIARLLMLRG